MAGATAPAFLFGLAVGRSAFSGRAQEGQLEARPGVNPAVTLSLFGHCACYCACNFVISPLNTDRRTARPRPYKFCDCSKRFVIRLLVAVDQRRDVLPTTGCRDIFDRKRLSLGGPKTPKRVPKTSIRLRRS